MSMGIGTNAKNPDEGELKRELEKIACGVPIQEYRCSTVVGNQEYLFRLYYYLEQNCWKISWEGM